MTDDTVSPESRLLAAIGALAGWPHNLPADTVKPLLDLARAATSAPEPGIDVERLARAAEATERHYAELRAGATSWKAWATHAAAEYARLRGATP